MNYKMIGYVLGRIFLVEAVLMILPMFIAILYSEPVVPFLIPIFLLLIVGGVFGIRKPQKTSIFAREGFVVVALAWIFMSIFGALPFVVSGDIPNYVDAFFETVSGFTTTGASILAAVEEMSYSCIFWRSFTHWVGGMGVLMFVMAVLPMSDGSGMHLMRAEVPGPSVGKLVSRMGDTAKILYGIYFGMTVIQIVLLALGGMNFFDSCVHAFGTAGTGGFSSRNLSIGAYNSPYFDIVIGVFMMLFGINFNLFYFLLIRKFRDVFKSEELRTYILVIAAATVIIAIDICRMYSGIGESLRHAFFQVSSIITTTGYATVDFNTWPALSKVVLVTIMFIGACAGSTGGGLKVARVNILVKSCYQDMRKMLHPNAVSNVRFEGKGMSDREVRSVHMYFTMFFLVFAISVLLLSLENFDLVTTFTAVAACINNIGPGLEVVGPMGNFSSFSALSKLLLSFDMLIGRLEIFPMILLFSPSVWVRKRKQK
ncbi:MAG: TrkH family potassium uptake protein [Oscillospiraceae bacterium]|nr:TrkH family potassium uptake protein [Oscillospiraceae bacterium]